MASVKSWLRRPFRVYDPEDTEVGAFRTLTQARAKAEKLAKEHPSGAGDAGYLVRKYKRDTCVRGLVYQEDKSYHRTKKS